MGADMVGCGGCDISHRYENGFFPFCIFDIRNDLLCRRRRPAGTVHPQNNRPDKRIIGGTADLPSDIFTSHIAIPKAVSGDDGSFYPDDRGARLLKGDVPDPDDDEHYKGCKDAENEIPAACFPLLFSLNFQAFLFKPPHTSNPRFRTVYSVTRLLPQV